ncbi:phospholipase D family protein [Variovorax sp.]|uniref:phospholipase D family protein n=1 Tax=Variovorax sp. TaxID=1871043 RepID=UPI000AF190F1|nr:phospholipase D family protein [Variovorax sp.]
MFPDAWMQFFAQCAFRRLGVLLTTLATAFLVGCAGLPSPSGNRQASHAIAEYADTTLGKLAQRHVNSSAVTSGFRLLPEAAFAFDARVALVRSAERSLDVQYYLIRSDDAGLQFLRELRDAAARGVRVRLLVDDLYTGGEEELFATLATFPNVEVRHFNPLPSRAAALPARLVLSFFSLLRVNHRMHNKLLVADNSFAISGGRNIGNEYFMRDASANFIDVDLLSCGPIVRELSKSFDAFWNSAQVWSISDLAPLSFSASVAQRRFDERVRTAAPDVALRPSDILGHSPVGEQLITGKLELHQASARLYADSPEKLLLDHEVAYRGSVSEGALYEVASSQTSVQILSPYFIPGLRGMAVLKNFVASGGRAVVITNSLGSTDEPLTYAGYERYRPDLLKIGVTVYEIAPEGPVRPKRFGDFGKSLSRLHAKVALMDDERIFVGSMNLDYRSASINTELGLVVESPAMVKEFNSLIAAEHIEFAYRLRSSSDGRTQWLSHDADGEHIVHEDVPGDFLWLRIKNWLLLPILGEELL